ncbi:MAG TPA: OmcA/MtrC family decaheme c-type cytochrome, partial [Burkholderiaceae bacterium]|nr:OmcA/MtrC family decaheme c-type cytochrome [Burkholderiaceae bacterium]
CHTSTAGTTFYTKHTDFALQIVGPNGKPTDIPNSSCQECHRVGTAVSPGRVHWNQAEDHAAKYKVNIASATFDPAARKVTVKYSVSDPTNNNALWNLVTPDCTGSGAAVSCSNTTQFGNLRFYLAYMNIVGQPASVTEFTSYNNGGSGASAFLYKGTNDGNNNYSVDIQLPPDSATAVAQGTARVVGIGQIIEPELQTMSAIDPRPPVPGNPPPTVNVVAQNTYADVVLTGTMNPRRQVVSNEKCSVCHAALGTTTGSNTQAYAFHGGARHTVESCVLCHDQNRYTSTVMTNGRALSENYAFKRMIHGIHGTSRRAYPFTHGNSVIGAFNKSGILTLDGLIAASSSTSVSAPAGTLLQPWSTGVVVPAGTPLDPATVTNYAAEVYYPQLGLNCNACHVNNSWQSDPNPVGAVVTKPIDPATMKAGTDPRAWFVISPRAASCTACHDSTTAINHVVGTGGSSFGQATQAQSFQLQENCMDCHANGKPFGVDVVHTPK